MRRREGVGYRRFGDIAFALVTIASLAAILSQAAFAAADGIVVDPALSAAVAAMRGIDFDSVLCEEREAKAQEIDAAWETLIGAGPAGRAALLAELDALESGGDEDDYFRLSAAALLWRIGGLDEATMIADTWRQVPFEKQYPYVFYTAYEAALTRDLRALPMLVTFLGDKSGSMFLPQHCLDIEWPLALEFVWGAYGPAGYPVLLEIAVESGDATMAESALTALCTSEYAEALPVARRLAIEGKTAGIRRAAIRLLGWHGRARDWELLLIGLTSDDVDDIQACLWALYQFGDERAVSYVTPFCDHPDPWVRDEALALLALMCTSESIWAIHQVCEERPDCLDLHDYECYADAVLWMAGLDWEAYSALPPAGRERAIAQARAILYGPRPGAAQLARSEALAILEQWAEQGYIDCDGLEDAENQIAAALGRDDIDALQELRASIYRRISDEAMYDAGRVERMIQKIVRRDLAGKGP